MLSDLVLDYKAHFWEDTELRAQENRSCSVLIKDGVVVKNAVSERTGVFARVFKGGLFGAAAGNAYDDVTIRRVLKEAERLAADGDKRNRLGEARLPIISSGRVVLDREIRPLNFKLHFELARIIDEYIDRKYPKLDSHEVRVRSNISEKNLAVSNGWDAHTAIVRAYVDISLITTADDGRKAELSNYFGKSCYLEDAFEDIEWLYEKIDNLYQQLMDYRQGVPPQAGVHDVILSPDLSGMLAHEAVGHTVEGDFVQGGSIAGVRMRQQVASPIVTLMDYAHTIPDGEAHCRVLVDDEGTPAQDCTIIENGILKNYLNSRQTARLYGGTACGCTRASDYYDEPMIRMRNTAIAPGKDTLEDMIASIEHGYYLVGNTSGQAGTDGEFMIGTSLGYEIKNGKIIRPVRDTTLSGIAFELLKTVTMVSNKQEWRFGGVCGKKQFICTAFGGPAIKCRAKIAGL